MVDVVLAKQRIEAGKTDRLREWMNEIQAREAEAVETLADEGMHAETAFVEHADDGDYLVYYMKADSIEEVYESFEDSDHEIDQEHKQVMADVLESGEDIGDYELLYHLENPERS